MSAFDPEKMAEQQKLVHECNRAEFARREALQRNRIDSSSEVVELDAT